MRKKLNILFGLVISFLMMIIPVTVLADGETMPEDHPVVTAVNAVQNSDTGAVDISGTAVDGWNDGEIPALAVTLLVYKEDNTLAAVKHVETTVIDEQQMSDDGGDGPVIKTRGYSTSINLPDGTYLIKAAIYEGGPFKETTITVVTETEEEDPTEEDPAKEDEPTKEEKTPEAPAKPEKEQEEKAATSENPETADNIMKIAIIFAIASLGAFTVITVNKKSQKKKAIK